MIYVEYVFGQKRIYGLTEEQRKRVMSDLTFLNPEYIQVKKFSKWNSTKIKKYLTYYSYNYSKLILYT